MTPTTKAIDTISVSTIATRKEERSMDIKASDAVVKVRLENIIVRRNFNRRHNFKEIEELADSIDQTGLQFPLLVDILKSGEVVLTDGERRLQAILELAKRSPELKKRFEYIDVKKNEKELSETDRLIIMMSTQSSNHFDALEEAEAYLDLTKGYMGEAPLTVTQIASRVGRPVPHVDQRLLLAKTTSEEKKLIREKKTSPTAMQELIRHEEDPEKRIQQIKEKNNEGKKHQVKDVKNKPVVEMCQDVLLIFQKIDQKFNPTGELGNLLLEARAKVNAIKKTIH